MRLRRAESGRYGPWLARLAVVVALCSASPANAGAASNPPRLRLAVALTPVPRPGASPRARVQLLARGARLDLVWPRVVTTRVSRGAGGLLLRFSRPLPEQAMTGIAKDLGRWLADLRYGYDTLLLRAAPGVRLTVHPHPKGVSVEIAAPPQAVAAGNVPARRRLALVAARLLAEQRDPVAARERLRALMRRYPEDIETLGALADIEAQLGDWREALRLYRRGLRLAPERADLIAAQASLLHEHGPRLRLAYDVQNVAGEDRQEILRASGRRVLNERVTLGTRLERRVVGIPLLQRGDGRVAEFQGVRERGEWYLRYLHRGGAASEIALLAGPSGAGLGLLHEWRGNYGLTRLRLDYARPTWDFVEGIADGGTVSRIGAAQETEFGRHWSVRLAGWLNRYGLGGDHGVADSWRAEAGVDYLFNPSTPLLRVGYRLDTEHILRRDGRLNRNGEIFHPLPVTSREEHAVEGQWADTLTDYLRFDALAGFSLDWLNGRGPYYGLGLIYEPSPGLEMGIRIDQSITSQRGGDAALSRLGAYLLWRM